MKKILGVLLVMFFMVSNCFGAWDKTKPADNGKLKDFPAQCRANWEAIEVGTDPALQVTNAKVANSAAITENKLSFDGTSGHDHTGGTSGKKIPLAAAVTGTLPIANGGTGLTSAGGTANRVMKTTDGTTFSMAQVSLTTEVTGTLPTANGGTGSTSTTYCSLIANVTGTLPTGNGGTGTTANANAANGVCILDGNGKIPVTALKNYDSGWFSVNFSTARTYTKTHNLGTTKILPLVYFSTDSGGANAVLTSIFETASSARGICVKLIDSNNVKIILGASQGDFLIFDDNGNYTYYSSGYCRVIVLALE